MRGGKGILDAESLVTDDLLSVQDITDSQRYIYDATLSLAQAIRSAIDVAGVPTAVDVQVIFKLVLALGISQKTLASVLGVTTGTLSRWVSGDNPPREFVRGPIIQELGKVVDYAIERLESYTRGRPTLKPQRRGAAVARMSRPHM